MRNMNRSFTNESPLALEISFGKLIRQYEPLIQDEDPVIAGRAKRVLELRDRIPELSDGFSDVALLKTYSAEIRFLLSDAFAGILTQNEIKAAAIPFENIIFNSSERFKRIIEDAGPDFELKMTNMPEEHMYIIACTIILKFHHGYDLNFKRPFLYEIPDKLGIMRYYKILYNADFMDIVPTEKAVPITQEDFDELLDNFDNLDLWKAKFPPQSYIYRGFVISNMFDVTDDQSISNIKSNLISDQSEKDEEAVDNFEQIFRSLLNIGNLNVGFSIYDADSDRLEQTFVDGMKSYLLHTNEVLDCKDALCGGSYKEILRDHHFYSISDVDKFFETSQGKAPQYRVLKAQGIKSAILAPIADESGLLGILELVSEQPKVLNSINANKLHDVMPYIVAAVQRSRREQENLIEAVIQQECTSIEPSVRWKFEAEAKRFLNEQMKGKQVSFRQLTFENVYPLFGQIDIKGSSLARNKATQDDLTLQLNLAKAVIESRYRQEQLPIYEQIMFQIDSYLDDLNMNFQVDTEQQISDFFANEISPLFDYLSKHEKGCDEIEMYNEHMDAGIGTVYKHRKHYDNTIIQINKELARLLDLKQEEAQAMYPHYFERFKTDGVEHNMYIGEAITKEDSFNLVYLYNLRLWQLQVMCEMENAYYNMRKDFPIQLDVASMILVFDTPLSISFRMDEKRFDVDGTYNARYEIVKKRVDKAFIKGTNERLTQKGKITIVYSQKHNEVEYLRYIKFLQRKQYVGDEVEILELEDLQAVTGLKAIRVNVLYHKQDDQETFYTYDDLIKELNA